MSEGQRDAGDQRDGEAAPAPRPRLRPSRKRDPHAVAAEAEEHGMGEGDDAGVAEQQVVARHQHDKDAHLGRRLRPARPEQERRKRERRQDQRQHHAQHRGCAARSPDSSVLSSPHRLATGYSPCGRHIRIITISTMLETSATLGAR